jgi:tetratricopeptide (TPR) repeat protein
MSQAAPTPDSDREPSPRRAAVAVAVLVGLVFLPVLGNGFVNWDDSIYVLGDPVVTQAPGTSLADAFTHFHASGNWHPLTTLVHAADFAVWGRWAPGHHLSSLLLHAANAGLVVLLVAALLRRPGSRRSRQGARLAAVTAGLCWALHPLRVESVAWASEHKDLLCALFYLLGLLAYLRYVDAAPGARRRCYLLTLAALLLALLAKPMAVSFPLVLLVLDAFPLGRLRRPGSGRVLAEKLPLAGMAAAAALLTLAAQRSGGAMRALAGLPFGSRALVAAHSAAVYLRQTLWPSGLCALYSYPRQVSIGSWRFLGPVLALVAAGVLAVRLRRRLPWLMAVMFATLLLLLPAAGLVQVGPQAMADRYTYLPGIAIALLAGAAFGSAWDWTTAAGHWWHRPALVLGLAAVGMGLSWRTWAQIAVWHDSESLWTNVLSCEPDSVEAHNARADYYYQRKDFGRALADYDAALAATPAVSETHAQKRRAAILNDRAVTLVQLGRLDEAVRDETEAIRLQPGRGDYPANRARMYQRLGRAAEARADWERAKALSAGAAAPPR